MDAAGLITSRLEFQDTIRRTLLDAATLGGREMLLVDKDFADWPLGEIAVVDALTRWAAPHRRLRVVAAHFDEVVRRHPRWVVWRRDFSHVVDCWAPDEQDAGSLQALLLVANQVGVHMSDTVHWRGRVSRERTDLLRWHEEVDALLQRSTPSFPATTLGL